MSNRKIIERLAGGNFEQLLLQALAKAKVPADTVEELVGKSRKHTAKAALGAGALGTAAGGSAGYAAGKREGAGDVSREQLLAALVEQMNEKSASKANTVMREFKQGDLRSGSKEGPKVESRDQAVAIALSEAREAGEDVPAKRASDFLTPEERMQLLHGGALLKCAHEGMGKQAIFESVGSIFDAGTKAVVVASAVTGIPVGIMAHLMSKATRANKLKEQDLKHQADFYRNAGQQLERNLANQGAQI